MLEHMIIVGPYCRWFYYIPGFVRGMVCKNLTLMCVWNMRHSVKILQSLNLGGGRGRTNTGVNHKGQGNHESDMSS